LRAAKHALLVMGKPQFLLPALRSKLVSSTSIVWTFSDYISTAAYVVAVLSHPEETKNATIRVEGAVASWNHIIKLLEEIQGKHYAVTYQSTEDAQAKETELWAAGNPGAARYGLRRVMAQGDAKLPIVQNDLFPEVKVTTDLQSIITDVLREKGLL
jgi:hypothetical protein